MEVHSLQATLSARDANYTSTLDKAGESAGELDKKSTGAAGGVKKVGLSLGSMVKGAAVFTTVTAGIGLLTGGIGSLVGEAMTASDSINKFKSTMDFAGFGQKEIDKATVSMKKYADDTVYDLTTVSNTTAQLAANGVKDYTSLTQAAGNLNSVAGGNAETFKGLAMMMTQTAGAGKLTTENWNQLADAIPGASGIMQKEMLKNGAYTGDFRDAMEKGEISADEFNKAIMNLGMTDAAKDAATSVTTFEGAIGALQAGVVDGINSIIEQIGKANMTDMISKIGDGIVKVIQFIANFVSVVVNNWAIIKPILAALLTAFLAFKVLSAISSVMSLFGASITLALGPVLVVIAIILVLAAAAYLVIKYWDNIKTFFVDLWESIKSIFSSFVDWMSAFLKEWGVVLLSLFGGPVAVVVALIVKYWDEIKVITVKVWNSIKEFFSSLWDSIKSIFSNVIDWIVGFLDSQWTAAVDLVKSIWGDISGFFGGMWDKVVGLFQGGVDNVKGWIDKLLGVFNKIKEFSLADAGRAIIDGFVNGLKAAWEAGKKFVSGIGDWIKDHKGPISYDKKLLIENGQSIMFGLDKGLQGGFGDVMGNVNGMAKSISGSFTADANQANKTAVTPLDLSVKIGKQDFKYFVEDISQQMGGDAQINRQF